MGWASGSGLFSDIIEAVVDSGLDETTRRELYERFIEIFEGEDCDTLYECVGQDKAFDEVFNARYPDDVVENETDWGDEDEDDDDEEDDS